MPERLRAGVRFMRGAREPPSRCRQLGVLGISESSPVELQPPEGFIVFFAVVNKARRSEPVVKPIIMRCVDNAFGMTTKSNKRRTSFF